MAATKLQDIMIPEVFMPYVVQESKTKSELFTSGMVKEDLRVQVGTRAGGESVHLPFWNEIDGDAEEIGDSTELSVNAITSGQDVAVAQFLGKAWGSHDLAGMLAGSNPADVVGQGVVKFWNRNMQKRIITSLKGVFGSASMAGNLHDISALSGAAAVIDKMSFADGMFKLGDAFGELTAVAMHSNTFRKLYKDDLIEVQKGSDGTEFKRYQGKLVFIDDTLLPDSNGVYTTYLFGEGAIAYAEGTPNTLAMEFDRHSTAGYDVMIMRRLMVLHPRGVKYTGAKISAGTATGGRPNLTDLATAGNWTRVYDPKNVRIVAMKHKVA